MSAEIQQTECYFALMQTQALISDLNSCIFLSISSPACQTPEYMLLCQGFPFIREDGICRQDLRIRTGLWFFPYVYILPIFKISPHLVLPQLPSSLAATSSTGRKMCLSVIALQLEPSTASWASSPAESIGIQHFILTDRRHGS